MRSFAIGEARNSGSGRSVLTLSVFAAFAALLFGLVVANLTNGARPAQSGDVLSLRSASAPAGSASIVIKNYAFSPASATVTVGTTVTWTNEDTAPHTVTVSDGPVKFDSGTLQQGQSYSYTFTTAGTYKYYCAVHPDMVASITVVPTTVTAPTPAPTTTPGTMSGGSTPMAMPMPGSTSGCGGVSAAASTFLAHVQAGHLGESPSQQAADILNADQYAKTHTVLVGNMAAPVVSGAETALNTFLTHVYAGHLGESPSQQAADILNADQYAKTHTVLVGNMAAPVVGTPGC